MLLITEASQYTPSGIFFTTSVKNNIIEKGLFTRILYSTATYTTNGLYLKDFTRAQLKRVEQDILSAYRSPKVRSTTLAVLPQGFWAGKVLTVSGIWETNTSYGLAYKFIRVVV